MERSVEYIRRKAFGPKDDFAVVAEAEEWLFQTLNKLNNTKQTGTGKTADELFLEESKVLGVLPGSKLICAEQIQLRVDKYATISFRTNRYSVPDHLVGAFVDVNVLSNELQIYYQNFVVASHKRSYEKHKWVMNIEHYLETFKRKPGALPGSLALASNLYLKNLYQEHLYGEPRAFIELLSFCKNQKVQEEQIEEAVKRLLSSGHGKLTTEKLRALLGNECNPRILPQKEDTISLMAKDQLLKLSVLMNKNC